jgi:outer membrane lipoprotein carrier protein
MSLPSHMKKIKISTIVLITATLVATCLGEETRAGAPGFFYGKSPLPLGADRQRTSLVHPQTRMTIHPRSGEGGILAFSRISRADVSEDRRLFAEKLSSISAEFVQEKHMKILSRPLVSGGSFYFKVPNSLRWEYRYPVQSVLLAHDGKTKRYIRRDGVIIEDAGAHLQSLHVVLEEITRWLKGRFDENPAFAVRQEPGPKIVLSPKEKNLASMILRIELIFSDQPGIMKSVVIYEGEDSFTRLDFKNVLLNQPLDDSLFRKF